MSQVPSVFIDLPSTWIQIAPLADAWEAQFEVMDRLAKAEIPPAVPSAVRLLMNQIGDKESEILAYYLDAVQDEETGTPYLIAATLGVSLIHVETTTGVEDLDDALRSRVLRGGLVETDPVECDGRPAIRTIEVVDNEVAGESSLDVRFYVPIPSMNLVAVAAFATPNAALRDEWMVVFNQIGQSVGVTQVEMVDQA